MDKVNDEERAILWLEEKIICKICGKEDRPATPIFNMMCSRCYRLYRNALSPKVFTLGHPANATYIREENKPAKELWFAHLRKHGFIKKGRKWLKK